MERNLKRIYGMNCRIGIRSTFKATEKESWKDFMEDDFEGFGNKNG